MHIKDGAGVVQLQLVLVCATVLAPNAVSGKKPAHDHGADHLSLPAGLRHFWCCSFG